MDLYLDLAHELTHLRQLAEGKNLWDHSIHYVDRLTEIEGYAVAVEEGLRLGMTEAQILSHFGASLFDGSNQLLLDAILNAPPGFEMLSEQNLRRLRRIRATILTEKTGAGPGFDRGANALIMEIFTLTKSELDRLRKEELAGNSIKKQPAANSE